MACRRVGLNPVEFLWNESAEKLSDFNGYVIVGGFAYEDRSRAGVIAALDPIMKQIKIEAELEKPIMGHKSWWKAGSSLGWMAIVWGLR